MTASAEGRETSGSTGRIPADTFANRLLLARRLAGLTIREASALTGLNYGSWSNWENGSSPLNEGEVCKVISEKLDVDLSWLLYGGPLTTPEGKSPGGRTKVTLFASVGPLDSRPPGRPGSYAFRRPHWKRGQQSEASSLTSG